MSTSFPGSDIVLQLWKMLSCQESGKRVHMIYVLLLKTTNLQLYENKLYRRTVTITAFFVAVPAAAKICKEEEKPMAVNYIFSF